MLNILYSGGGGIVTDSRQARQALLRLVRIVPSYCCAFRMCRVRLDDMPTTRKNLVADRCIVRHRCTIVNLEMTPSRHELESWYSAHGINKLAKLVTSKVGNKQSW